MRIVRTATFERSLKKLGGGARKARFSMAGRGESGGGRAIYVLVVRADTAYLLLAYSKKDQEDLSAAQRKVLAAIVKELTNG